MRLNINKKIFLGLTLVSSFVAMSLVQSCKDEESMKWVDLRYRVEDAYTVAAKNPETISFVVKSTDKWEVFGIHDWHTITPAMGEPGEKYTVELLCNENTNLDDRTDTITIKSDYWVGKKFTVTQKGTAYLNIDHLDNIAQEGGEETFDVLSNQKWTAKVTKGNVWLSLAAGESGEKNGKITVKAKANMGEQRVGVVTIYDRHGEVAQEVQCVQNGVILTPEVPENQSYFVLYEQAQQLSISVESNGEWTVSKEDEEATWFSFEKTSFTGSDNIVINVSEHVGSQVREGIVVLKTKASEGVTPLVKKVRFKQANPQIPVVTEVNRELSNTYYGPSGAMPGRYNFYFESFTGNIKMFFIWGKSELRFHVIGNQTNITVTPWANVQKKVPVDPKVANVLSWEIQKKVDEKNPSKAWVYTEWILNGEVIQKCVSDGLLEDGSGKSDNWKLSYEEAAKGGKFQITPDGGKINFTKYEYIAPLNWGE